MLVMMGVRVGVCVAGVVGVAAGDPLAGRCGSRCCCCRRTGPIDADRYVYTASCRRRCSGSRLQSGGGACTRTSHAH